MNDPLYMNCLDIYSDHCKTAHLNKFQNAILNSEIKLMPLMSWDIFMTDYFERITKAIMQNDKRQIKKFAYKYNWQNDVDALFDNREYEAIVITDNTKNIIWVNQGFTEMTGYAKSFALNKTPRFLQGGDTSEDTISRIDKHIADKAPFKDVVLNYKKDGTPYKCEIQVVPLYNRETTHYIAFEKQVG